MKLLTKNTIVLLIVTLFVFIIGGFVFYYQLQNIMNEEAIEALYAKKEKVEKYISITHNLPEPIYFEELLSFNSVNNTISESINDKWISSEELEEEILYKQLIFNVVFENQNYQCTISKSLFEADDLIETILQSLLLIIILLIIVFMSINYFFSKKTWQPFFKIIKSIDYYEVEKHQLISPESCSTKEFQQLSDAIVKMTQKIAADFNALKSFSENASHELQTPLAIIKNKTELLLQTENLNKEQVKEILEINQTANRLSKLNQTLLLLSKIENNQFIHSETIHFSEVLKNKLIQFEDLIAIKKLKMICSIDSVNLIIHPVLADVVVSNLLSNAIRHSSENGEVRIELTNSNLKFSNQGKPLKASGEILFQRFYKENPDSESTGLGLALVKQISIINKHKISHSFNENFHVFNYLFKL